MVHNINCTTFLNLERMTKWRVVLEPDEETGEWTAWCPELSGCISEGATEAEALNNIREAIRFFLEPTNIEDELTPNSYITEVTV